MSGTDAALREWTELLESMEDALRDLRGLDGGPDAGATGGVPMPPVSPLPVSPLPVSPVPDTLRSRAGRLLAEQLRAIRSVERELAEVDTHLAALRAVPTRRPLEASAFLDAIG